MPKHTSNHARHSGHGFEEDETDEPFGLAHLVWLCGSNRIGRGDGGREVNVVFVARSDVGAPSEQSHHSECDTVGEVFGLTVGKEDVFPHFCFGESKRGRLVGGLDEVEEEDVYPGCGHAGGVLMIWLCSGSGKISRIRVCDVEEKDRLLIKGWPAVWFERPLHWAKLATAFESWAAVCLVRGTRVEALATYIAEKAVDTEL